MSAYEQKELSGVLFKNDKDGVETRPDYRGNAKIDGSDYEISAWIKEGRKGKFMSLSFQTPRNRTATDEPRRKARDDDEEIPF